MGRKNKNAIKILNAATWEEENANIPFFMRMNELPHTNESVMKMIQLFKEVEFLFI